MDRRSCELGKDAKCKRQSHGGLQDANSWECDDHVCGHRKDIPMFNFLLMLTILMTLMYLSFLEYGYLT